MPYLKGFIALLPDGPPTNPWPSEEHQERDSVRPVPSNPIQENQLPYQTETPVTPLRQSKPLRIPAMIKDERDVKK